MIHVGTSGWHYPTGRGTWNGVFYPARRPRGFDELAYYAEHFDTVEVNSTFYRMPEPGLSAKWIARTPDRFQFAIKLFQKFTHPDMFLARPGVHDWDLSLADVDLFRAGVDPIAAAGRLAAVLLQFPPSFHDDPEMRAYLDWLLGALRGYPLAVELRHRTWSDRRAETQTLLGGHDAAWVLIDEPKFRDSVRQTLAAGPGPLTYIRLHGRNAANWWEPAASEDRYDYLYSREELRPFAEVARAADADRPSDPGGAAEEETKAEAERSHAAARRRVLLYMNNHFSAKAVANAAVLRHEVGQLVPGSYLPEMIARYPQLEGIVTPAGLPL